MKLAILGFGREGRSLLAFLRKQPEYKGAEIWVLDRDKKIKTPKNVRTQTGKNYLKNLSRFDVVFRSPGIPYRLPEIQRAKKAGVKISSATKLFFYQLNHLPFAKGHLPVVIGITGSKGKSTTATLLYRILKAHRHGSGQAADKNVFLAGNIGTPAFDLLPKLTKNSWIVLELSSFQLEDLAMSPHIAVVLDVFPEHQDSHGSLGEYCRAKTNINRHQKPGDAVFYFSDNPVSRRIGILGKGRKIRVDISRIPHSSEWFHGIKNSLQIRGEHNLKNAVMAAAVASRLGIPTATIRKSIKNFRGLPHRLQFVKKLGQIEFYDDSASHNPNAAIAAIKSFPDAIKVLIAGGKDRPFDYRTLGSAAEKNRVAIAVLFGENKGKIARALHASRVSARLAGTLREAVRAAYREAKTVAGKNPGSDVIVLFSPGAPSYDMFKNFEERGRAFVKAVKSLKKPYYFGLRKT